ncbi:MAG: hypothetical protein HZA52_16335 [Planctomycetes bacterium]|nr:hypothetical protein [Planctomycetota bacterium]
MFQLLAAALLAPVALAFATPSLAQSQSSSSPTGPATSATAVDVWVRAQQATPGTAQPANSNITGTSIAGSFQGNGSALFALNASQIASGTLGDARLSANVALLAATQTFTGLATFSVAPSFTAPGTPFTVSSTTKVSNLNADRLDGLDSSAFLQSIPNPLYVGDATPGGFAIGGESSASGGTGLYGGSTSSSYGIGASAVSNYGSGVLAISYGGPYPAVEANGNLNGNGVTAYGGLNGVEGHSSGIGYSGVSGFCTSSNGSGVRGEGFVGVEGYNFVDNGAGLYGYGGGTNGYGVLAVGRVYILGDLTVTGSKFGYVVDLVKNADLAALEPGDVVEIVGYEPALVGEIPVTLVRRATNERASAVLGPIDCAVALEPLPTPVSSNAQHGLGQAAGLPDLATARAPRRAGGSIAPGEYGNVVTLGAFRAIRVDSSYGAIRAGDLLVASSNPGYAMAAADPRIGTVIGKALSDWSGGLGEIPVMVSSR